MKLKDIASISGKPGLFKILKPIPNGVIVETLDEQKKRMSVGATHRVSVLKEVSIYTQDEEGSINLENVLHAIREEFKDKLPITKKSPDQDLRDFIELIVPNYDRDQVYLSDVKKLVSWYGLLQKHAPEVLETLLEVEEEAQEADGAEEESKEDGKKTEAKKEKAAEKKKTRSTSAKTKPKQDHSKPKASGKKGSPKKTGGSEKGGGK